MGGGMEKIRPQILLAMIIVGLVAGVAMAIGWKMDNDAIVTPAITGAFGTLTALGMKILEKQE
jgi:ABC-type enterochelin transport system permease subunit